MGYRSDVAYLIAFPNGEELDRFILSANTLSKQPVAEDDRQDVPREVWGDMTSALGECLITRGVIPSISFYHEGVKWYPTYDDVAAHNSLFDLAFLHHVDGGKKMTNKMVGGFMRNMSLIAGDFLRIGEDDNDAERRGFGVSPLCDNMSVERRITFFSLTGELFKNRDI